MQSEVEVNIVIYIVRDWIQEGKSLQKYVLESMKS